LLHVKINEWPIGTNKVANLIHFTLGQNLGAGHRIPAIWITDRHLMHICSYINGKSNFCFDRGGLSVGDWNEVCIFQTKNEDEKYYFGVNINGEQAVSQENTKPAEYKNIKVYVSDMWYDAAIGQIKNLKIMQNIEGWVSFPGLLDDIDVGPLGVWGVNHLESLYKKKDSTWKIIEPKKLTQISVGRNVVWGVNKAHNILKKEDGEDWNTIRGGLIQVSVCANADTYAWGINSAYDIFFDRDTGGHWHKSDGKLSMVSCGDGGVWGIGIDGHEEVFYRINTYGDNSNHGREWVHVDGALSWISSGKKGEVWGTDKHGNVWKRAGITDDKPTGSSWVAVSSAKTEENFKRVAVWNGMVWGVTDESKIFYRKA